jgi:endogenous inhibitor of DNA gyrase (YacG/DUF329 family)
MADLGRWLSEDYRVPDTESGPTDEAPPDEESPHKSSQDEGND